MLKIKRDDELIVLAGKDKGKRGKIVKVLGDKVIVAGVNMAKHHVKPNPQAGVQGGIVEQEAAIHVSNVAIYNTNTNKADRVGFKFDENGVKTRFYKSTNEVIK